MSLPIIEIRNLSKLYHVGQVGHTSFRDLAERWVGRLRGRGKRAASASAPSHHFSPEQQGPEPDSFWALKDVSFDVQPGEVVGIIGRNGAGKSTLLKVLSRITEPTTGEIKLRGRVASLLEVGTGFHPELTGRENIFLNGAILGMTRAEIRRKFDEIVAFAEVENFIDTPVKRYSSGMYVRLAFAVAAHLEPEILIVDEVLAVGDVQFQEKCLGKMNEVAQNGRTVLFVSHNMPAIRELCQKGVLLQKGKDICKGDICDVLKSYLSLKSNAETTWRREVDSLTKDVALTQASLELFSTSDGGNLVIDFEIESRIFGIKLMIAVDILAPTQEVIMQALPYAGAQFGPLERKTSGKIKIKIPPLVPGKYYIDIWLGRSINETSDYQKRILSFEVIKSPTYGRTYPHDPRHGYCVPPSTVEML